MQETHTIANEQTRATLAPDEIVEKRIVHPRWLKQCFITLPNIDAAHHQQEEIFQKSRDSEKCRERQNATKGV